jgi:hypothetical protein
MNSHTPEDRVIMERRKYPRLNVELPLDYSPISDREDYGGVIVNANEGGILVYLSERLELGDLFRVKIFATGESEVNTIEAIAKIVWVDSGAVAKCGKYRYGLQLQSFYKGDLNKFRALLREAERNPGE